MVGVSRDAIWVWVRRKCELLTRSLSALHNSPFLKCHYLLINANSFHEHITRRVGSAWLWVDFIECLTTTFLRTHYWLNWVAEGNWWGWGWRNKTRSTVSAGKRLDPNFAIIGTCGLGKVQVCHAWRHLQGVKYPGQVTPTTGSFDFGSPQRCSKLLNLKGWTAFNYHYSIF